MLGHEPQSAESGSATAAAKRQSIQPRASTTTAATTTITTSLAATTTPLFFAQREPVPDRVSPLFLVPFLFIEPVFWSTALSLQLAESLLHVQLLF